MAHRGEKKREDVHACKLSQQPPFTCYIEKNELQLLCLYGHGCICDVFEGGGRGGRGAHTQFESNLR